MTQEPEIPQLVLEHVDPRALGLVHGPEGFAVPPPVLEALAALARSSPRPREVTLVLSGDLDESVRDRHDVQGKGRTFQSDRGSGTVGGKTLRVAPDKFDVLLHAWMFLSDELAAEVAGEGGADPAERHWLAKHTIVHEAQHVALGQRAENSDERLYEHATGLAHLNFLAGAGEFLDEYRCEVAAEREAPSTSDDDRGVIDALEHHRAVLAMAYSARAQGGSIDEFLRAVMTSSGVLWKVLAYLAAYLAASGGSGPSTATLRHPLWSRYVAPDWEDLVGLTRTLPEATQPSTREDLDLAQLRIADVLATSFQTFGFAAVDEPGGGTRVDILPHGHDHAA